MHLAESLPRLAATPSIPARTSWWPGCGGLGDKPTRRGGGMGARSNRPPRPDSPGGRANSRVSEGQVNAGSQGQRNARGAHWASRAGHWVRDSPGGKATGDARSVLEDLYYLTYPFPFPARPFPKTCQSSPMFRCCPPSLTKPETPADPRRWYTYSGKLVRKCSTRVCLKEEKETVRQHLFLPPLLRTGFARRCSRRFLPSKHWGFDQRR
jgi:hypothetical protein